MDTFPTLLFNQARVSPDQAFIRTKSMGVWRVTTWAEACDRVSVLAQGFSNQGLKAGDRFGIFGPNGHDMYLAYLAAQSLGAIPVPISNNAYGESLRHQIEGARVEQVLALEQQHVDALLECGQQCIRGILYISYRGMENYTNSELVRLETLLEDIRPSVQYLEQQIQQRDPNETAVIAMSSGTVTQPRLIELSHSAIISTARSIANRGSITSKDNLLAYLPLGTSSDILYSFALTLVSGCCMNCPESDDTVLENMQEIGPSVLFGPSYVYKYIFTHASNRIESASPFETWMYKASLRIVLGVADAWANKQKPSLFSLLLMKLVRVTTFGPMRNVYGLSRIRLALSGGAGLSPKILRFFRAIGVDLRETYGMAEGSCCLTMQDENDWIEGTMGPPLDGVELAIRDGEIWFRGPGQMNGIYNDSETTAATTVDGWTRTHDAGTLDEQGHLKVRGRKARLGSIHGLDFEPDKIEASLKASEYIRQAIVYGDGKDYPVAVIAVDGTITRTWADRRNLRYTGYADLSTHVEVQDLVRDQIQRVNAVLATQEETADLQIKRFVVFNREFTAAADEVTSTRKTRWEAFSRHHAELLNALYSGAMEYTYTDATDERRYTLSLGEV